MIQITWGIIIACGKTEQIAPEVDTPYLDLNGKPVLTYSLMAFERCPDVEGIILVVAKDRVDGVAGMSKMYGFSKVKKIVAGSSQRFTCVQQALKALEEEVFLVVVHDATRACVTPELISETVKAAKRYGTGVAAVKLEDSVKEVKKGMTVLESLNEKELWSVQTPQAFRADQLVKGYEQAAKKKWSYEDDSIMVGLVEKEIHLVESTSDNLKIRNADDLKVAGAILRL